MWRERPFGELTPTDLEQAKANLHNHFAVVGLMDRFDETLLLLQDAFGWQKIQYKKKNVTKDRPKPKEVSPQAMAHLQAFNQFDNALYHYAQDLFEEKVNQQGASFPQKLQQFQAANQNAKPAAEWNWRQYSVRQAVKQWVTKWK